MDGRKLKMARITGGLRMSQNSRKDASVLQSHAMATSTVDIAPEYTNATASLGQSLASQASGAASTIKPVIDNASERQPAVTIDVKRLKLPLAAEIDSGRTPHVAGAAPAQVAVDS